MNPINRMAVALVIASASSAAAAGAQGWEIVQAPTTTSLRGVSAPSRDVVWVSGARGAVARSVDGGGTWAMVGVPGTDSLDFRDIHALDASTAWVLSIGNGGQSRIYRTTDGGRRWALQFTNPDTAAFYDCFGFWDARRGIAMSDPVGGRLRILRTDDGGETWSVLPPERSPVALEGEAGFAASGTCIITAGEGEAWIVTGGGARSRAHRTRDFGATWQVADIPPIVAGAAPRGAFTVAHLGDGRLVATGGNYELPTDTSGVAALSDDSGLTWRAPRGAVPRGYRSGLAAVPGLRGVVVAVGTSGTDYSLDGGESWVAADTLSLNAVTFAAPDAGWAVGPRGRVVRWRGGFPRQVPRRDEKEPGR